MVTPYFWRLQCQCQTPPPPHPYLGMAFPEGTIQQLMAHILGSACSQPASTPASMPFRGSSQPWATSTASRHPGWGQLELGQGAEMRHMNKDIKKMVTDLIAASRRHCHD